MNQIPDQSAPRLPGQDGSAPKLDIRQRVELLEELPVIPEMALQLMELRNDPDATVEQLAEVIKLDPALAAQIIRYANSPLYGQHGQIDELEEAIFRVLGYETVLYIALGSSVAQAFSLPQDGPLGLTRFWRNAVFSAALVHKLAEQHRRELQLKPGSLYLGALLHNIGFLVLASLFESEYFWLNKVLKAKPDLPIIVVERQLLGIDHTELGKMLLTAWHFPEEIIDMAAGHHNLNYAGEHATAVTLIQLTDQLLATHGMSDAASDEVSPELCERLNLQEDALYLAMDDVLAAGDMLDTLAQSFS
jgi:HD-like signal output (HDOD) protein